MSLHPKPSPLVDNLYVERAVGNASLMNLASGRFRLSGRCLTVDTGDVERTPVFTLETADVDPRSDRLMLGGVSFDYGVLYLLPGAAAGPQLSAERAGGCPRGTVIVRSVERRESVPEPSTPPPISQRH
jgi:hypothetical protein